MGNTCGSSSSSSSSSTSNNTSTSTNTTPTTPVYNCQCYLARYTDLQKAFGTNCTLAKNHRETYGKNEKRDPSCEEVGSESVDEKITNTQEDALDKIQNK